MSADSKMEASVYSPPSTGCEYDSKNAPLDPTLYDVDAEFLSTITGIKDPEELKQHVMTVQADAYAVHPYPCIRTFTIARTKIDRYPAYRDLLKLAKEREGAVLLDTGCCVGNDIRKAILDGYPANQIIGTDLNAGFWDIGHKLFKSTPESFPVKFLPGNVFESSFLEPREVLYTKPSTPVPDLSSLTSLTPLIGHVSAIHASAFFHLFNEERQLQLAKLFALLLSPEPGSIAFGSHVGLPQKGLRMGVRQPGQKEAAIRMFCHSPQSWTEMWEDVIGKGKVEVWATMKEVQRRDCVVLGEDTRSYILTWSVKRI